MCDSGNIFFCLFPSYQASKNFFTFAFLYQVSIFEMFLASLFIIGIGHFLKSKVIVVETVAGVLSETREHSGRWDHLVALSVKGDFELAVFNVGHLVLQITGTRNGVVVVVGKGFGKSAFFGVALHTLPALL